MVISPVIFPALFTPANGAAFTNVDGTAENVSASAPLPVTLSSPGTVSASETAGVTAVSAATANFMGGSIHATKAGTTCTITYVQSNDKTNSVTLPVISAVAANPAPTTTFTTTGISSFVSSAAFLRTRVSTYTSGTVSVVLNQKPQVVPGSGLSLAAGCSGIGSVSMTGTATASGTVNPGIG